MPVPPYTWQTDDFLTASRLNGELRRVNGQPYLGNGPGWHAQRPLYKSYLTPNALQSANTGWQQQFNGGGAAGPGCWTPLIDTAAFLGGRGDLAAEGAYFPSGLTAGGGATNAPAGLNLVWDYQPFNSGTGSASVGLGLVSGNTPTVTGTVLPFNSNFVAGWAGSIMDGGAKLTGYYNTPDAAGYAGTDGSGTPPRQHALWASVYTANGHTVASIPSITTGYTGSSALTSSGFNAQIAATMNLLNMPPLLKVQAIGTTSCTNGVETVVSYSAPTYDTYTGFAFGTGTYTVPLPGLYLVMAFAGFDSPGAGYISTGVKINGTVYNGPTSPSFAGDAIAASKVQIFSLNQGDTIQHVVQQTCGSTQSTSSTNFPSLVVLFLGAQGAPGSLPSVPDFTYLFQAGTPAASMPGVLNSYLANDLSFLLQRPYCLAYQTTPQTAFAQNIATPLTLQSNTGIVHGDSAASYGGWSTNTYTAPRPGWYLCVNESFLAQPAGSTEVCRGGFVTSPAGASPDQYEVKNLPTRAGGGASAMSLYYLRTGDTIQPTTNWGGTTGTLATYATAPNQSHFECVWVSA